MDVVKSEMAVAEEEASRKQAQGEIAEPDPSDEEVEKILEEFSEWVVVT